MNRLTRYAATFAAACVSWEIKTREKEFYILLLVMAGGILGAFASLDLFMFYFFHELCCNFFIKCVVPFIITRSVEISGIFKFLLRSAALI